MVEPRLVSDIPVVFGISRPKVVVGSQGSAVAGGKTGISLERRCGSPTVVVWSQGIYVGRAKIAMGCELYGSVAVERLQ
jgi:hypothetical protein